MAVIIRLDAFAKRPSPTPLVLMGLHEAATAIDIDAIYKEALRNCEQALGAARSVGIPVAFIRQVLPMRSKREGPCYPPWMEGFWPQRHDMVFSSAEASCYSSDEFIRTIDDYGGRFAIAGILGEATWLSAALEGRRRNHVTTWLADAIICRAPRVMHTTDFHNALGQILSDDCRVMRSEDWLKAFAQKGVTQC